MSGQISLASVASKIGSGSTPRGGESSYLTEGIPFIRSQNVQFGRLEMANIAFISEEVHQKMSGTHVRPNDVLLNITGASIGRSTVVPDTVLEANVNQHVCIIRINTDKYNPQFLSEFLNSKKGQYHIDSAQSGGSRQGINFQEVGDLKIPDIKYNEQEKIVEILSDCDTAIEQTKKQIFRLGKEFEGFCNHLWQIGRHKKTLMQIGSFHAGLNGKTATDFGQGKRFITYMGVFNGPYIKDDAYGFVDVSPEENQHRIVNGDLLITMTSETKPETGYTAIFRSANADEDVYLNSFCVCYRSFDKDEHPPEVIHALMKSKHFRSKIWRISQGSTRINLSRSELGKLDLELPLQTQNEAAKRAVQDYAHHSEGLTKLLQKQNQQKHGLMQQLLTGKLRLKGAA